MHASAVFPAAVVSAFCGRWRKKSLAPGQFPKIRKREKKRKNQTDLLPARFGRKETERKKRGALLFAFFLFCCSGICPGGKRKKPFRYMKSERQFICENICAKTVGHKKIPLQFGLLGKSQEETIAKRRNCFIFPLLFFVWRRLR